MKDCGTHLEPDSHDECFVDRGIVFMTKYNEFSLCTTNDYWVKSGKNITFNDQYVTFVDKEGKVEYRELDGWFLKVYCKGKEVIDHYNPKAGQQIDIFEYMESL